MMTNCEMEIELKIKLNGYVDFLKLIGSLGPLGDAERQVSGFFDTGERNLGQAGWALRVRLQGKKGLVTAKGLASPNQNAWIRQEIEAEIDAWQARELLGGIGDPLDLDIAPVRFIKDEFDCKSLSKLLQFENKRLSRTHRIGDHECLFEIDSTEYADGSVDYELEVEVTDESHLADVEGHLRHMFGALDIPFEFQRQSKLERALNIAGLL